MRIRKFKEHFTGQDLHPEVSQQMMDSEPKKLGFNPDMQVTFHVPNFIIEICKEYGISEERIPDAFHSYVEGAMDEFVASGKDCPIVKIAKRDFRKWCENNAGN